MPRRAVAALPVLCALLFCSAGAQERNTSSADTRITEPTSFGPLDLYILYNPGCPTCQRVVALQDDLEALDSRLRVYPLNNTVAGDREVGEKLRKQAKLIPEAWGPSVAIYLGEGWDEKGGLALVDKIHGVLKDRVEIIAQPWRGDNLEALAVQRSEIEVMQELRGVRPGRLFVSGLRDSIRFEQVLLVLVMAALLVMVGGGARRTAAVGLSFWLGSVLLFIVQGLGAMDDIPGRRVIATGAWIKMGVALAIGLAALAEATRRWRLYKRSLAVSPSGPDSTAGAEPAGSEPGVPSPELPDRRPLRGPALLGLVVGAVLSFIALALAPPSATALLGEAWNLGKVPDIVFPLVNIYVLGATLPVLLVALLSWGLAAAPSLRRSVAERPADFRLAAFLLFLVIGIYLTVQSLSFLLDRVFTPG